MRRSNAHLREDGIDTKHPYVVLVVDRGNFKTQVIRINGSRASLLRFRGSGGASREGSPVELVGGEWRLIRAVDPVADALEQRFLVTPSDHP